MAVAEILVVGGGLAGAAVALHLANAGRSVTLLERETAAKPKVCGEFLSSTVLAELARLGVSPAALGAVPITTFSLSSGRHHAAVPLPFPAASLTRERLDEHLLAEAATAGASVRRGVSVRAITRTGTRTGAGWQAETAAGAVRAQRLVVATGKWDLRGHSRGGGRHEGLVGLKRYATLTAPGRAALGEAVEIVLVPGGYCGIEAVEDGRANVCLAVAAARVKAEGAEAIFASLPAASRRAEAILAGAVLHDPVLAIGRVPYGFVRRDTPGPAFVGDQAAVMPSVCGEGMGLALRSARLAAEAILAGAPDPQYQAAFAAVAGPVVGRATLLSRALCRPALRPFAAPLVSAVPRLASAIASAARLPA